MMDSSNNICWPTLQIYLSKAELLHGSLLGGNRHEGDDADYRSEVYKTILACARDASVDINLTLDQLPSEVCSIRTYGTPLTPEAFLQKACEVEDPLSVESCLPEELHQTPLFLATRLQVSGQTSSKPGWIVQSN